MSLSDEIETWLAEDIPGHVKRIVEIARLAAREGKGCSDGLPIPTPRAFRAVAAAHEVAAAELREHAAELRGYADDLELDSDLGVQLADHFRAISEGRAHRQEEHYRRLAVARGEGGVVPRFGDGIGCTLAWGGLPTVDDVRAALVDGRLMRVHGIGPASFAKIARELQPRGEGADTP